MLRNRRSVGLILLAALVFSAGFAVAGWLPASQPMPPPPPPAVTAPDWPNAVGYPAEVLKVNDGDTFEARVAIWPGMHVTTKVRLRGIDTPERRAHCVDEHRKAAAATEMMEALLADRPVRITNVDLDKYDGRVLADVSTRATPDVAAALLHAGLARRYEGGRRESWCAPAASR